MWKSNAFLEPMIFYGQYNNRIRDMEILAFQEKNMIGHFLNFTIGFE
jgi:hypothetical protein